MPAENWRKGGVVLYKHLRRQGSSWPLAQIQLSSLIQVVNLFVAGLSPVPSGQVSTTITSHAFWLFQQTHQGLTGYVNCMTFWLLDMVPLN